MNCLFYKQFSEIRALCLMKHFKICHIIIYLVYIKTRSWFYYIDKGKRFLCFHVIENKAKFDVNKKSELILFVFFCLDLFKFLAHCYADRSLRLHCNTQQTVLFVLNKSHWTPNTIYIMQPTQLHST